MSLVIKALDAEKKEVSVKIDSEADFCPVCNRHQLPGMIAAFKPEQDNCQCQIVFQCSNKKCLSFYIAYYDKPHPGHEVHYLRNIAPRNFQELTFESEIEELSPNFREIFQESHFAELQGYKQVAGAGYRRALEFLVKDFCVGIRPEKEKEIRGSLLTSCINDCMADPRLMECAARAAWLKDEAHAVRRWDDRDLMDLKALVQLTKNWIVSQVQAEKYLKEANSLQKAAS